MEKIRKQQGHVVARNHRDCKESEIFVRFEISMLNSYDMTLVREKYGIEGWGIVLYIMTYLIERRTDGRAPLYVVGEIAHACHKNRRTILQLIADFPSLFEIEAGGKIFSSPYLLRFFLKTSAKKEKSNRSLDKLTNETLDNQEVSFPKNKNKEQEQITTKEKKRKETSPSPRGTSPSPSQGGENVDDGRRLREIGTSPDPSQGGENDADGKRLRREESITAMHSAISCVTKQRKTQKTEVRHRTEQTAAAPPTQAEMGVTRELLSQLYQDNEYMTSLERIANLAVRTNFAVRRNLLFWFQYYCQSHAKRVKDIADAKDYLANLMRPGSNTRAHFMAYQNRIYERNYQMKMQSQRNEQQNAGRINAGCCQS